MKKFLCYDTNDAASGKIEVDNRGMLKPNSTVPSGGAPYQQLVTDGTGTAKWEDRLAYEDSRVVVSFEDGVQLVKVSDEIPSWASVDASTKVWMNDGTNENSLTVAPKDNVDFGNGSFMVKSFVFFIMTDNSVVNTLAFPKKGVYFLQFPEYYVSGISSADSDTPEIAWDGSTQKVKTIDEIYLPESVFLNADFNQIDEKKPDFIKNRTHGIASKSFTYVHNMSGDLNGWQGAYNSQRHFDLVSGAEYHVVGRITITERNQTPVVLNVDSKVTSRVNENSVELVIPGTIVATSNTYSNFRVCKGSFWYSVSSTTTVNGVIDVDLEIGEGILALDNKYVPKNYRVIFEQTSSNVFQCTCPYSELKDFAVAGYPIYGVLLNRIVSTDAFQYNLIMVRNAVDAHRMEFEFTTGEGGTTRLYYYEDGHI